MSIRKQIMIHKKLRLAKITKENIKGFFSYVQYKERKKIDYIKKTLMTLKALESSGNLATWAENPGLIRSQ